MRIVFAGTPDFAVPTLQALIDSDYSVCAVYTQPDRPAGRGRRIRPGPVKALALTHGIPVFQPASLKTDSELDRLRTLRADLMIVVAYGMILPQTVLDIPRLGCINAHASLLPRWRGAAPIQRAIMAGDAVTGVTIMRIEPRLDAGPMFCKAQCRIGARETASELHDRLAVLGAHALMEVLPDIEAGKAVPETQDESEVTYADKLEKQDAFLDWSRSALELERKVRALNAWPVAQTIFQGKMLRIWRAEALQRSMDAAPGEVLDGHGKVMDVATGSGVLRLTEVQLPGGRCVPIEAFLNAHDVRQVRLG